MAKYELEVSQNGWEYTGRVWIDSLGGVIKDDEDENAVYAGNVRIKFDEEIGSIKKVSE
ncbi:hypothetical protein [Bacillus sp. SM2101]|uniref:hypothetical protein n=1 Tax=Bacillus sp. SM2101 TaxID=2805366 RepID=UPI001BDE4D87|nr:hypothetical protein [Bacillus sp. SM2101]